jgi:hypothetical protein
VTDLKQFDDIRRYKLIIYISGKELRGYFKPYDNSAPASEAINVHLHTGDDDKLLHHIENGIYDNSILLNDYETTLVISTPSLLFFPKGISEEVIMDTMQRVYNADAEDVFTETEGDETVAFYLADGLKSFLNRTFPGVTVHNHLTALKRKFKLSSQRDARVYADIEGSHLNLMAFSGNKFLHGSVHSFNEINDAAYYIFSLWESLGFAADEAELNVSGPKEKRQELMTLLRKYINYVMLTIIPSQDSAEPLPATVALLSD